MKRIAAIMTAGALCACGCTRRVYVPVENVTRDTIRQVHNLTELIAVTDSVHVDRTRDTVVKERFRTIWREHRLTDTLRQVRTDTVTRTVTVPPAQNAQSQEWGKWLWRLLVICAAAYFMAWRRR